MDALETAKDILASCLAVPKHEIGDDASIYELKAIDSVTFETLVLEIEERIGREPDVEALLDMRTVRDLAGLIASGGDARGVRLLSERDTPRTE
ncbi:acyl carrier protein [Labrys monachus]|uniref:Acyl carrier protein n=1 Tax=Labrys monachus TaxID=217067 RepID=A0ABU0FL59_9HYPH|nr:acyl carrier protein [Labrys monachus]MDQ0395335.1 acyl carrier protein [Labrys monachus]